MGEKVKISNFIAYFFLKVKWVEPETFTGVSCLDAKWLWKVWGKTEWCFRVRPSEKLENLFGVGDKGKISNFIGCLFVKGKLVVPETFTGVYCPDNEGLWKVWGKTESWFPIEPPKNSENFFGVGEKGKISNSIAYFFLKVKWVEPETFTGVSYLDTEGLWKVWGKTEWCFPIQPPEKLENFFGVGEKGKISNSIGYFFLKGKRVEPETFAGVSCPDNEGIWKVWGKTESCFPIEPPENLENFFGVGEKGKISNSIGYFFLKVKWVEPETFTGVFCSDNEGLWKVWGKTESCFPIEPPENLENFFGVGEKGKISNSIGYFFLKVKWVEPETFTGVFCSDNEGLWKVWGKTEWWFPIQLSKNLEIFFRAGEKVKISNFIGSFFVKGKLVEPETFTGVPCPGTEGLWKVWGKTEWWFPIQLSKNLEIFFRAGEKVKISNFIGSFFVKGKLVEPETFTGVPCPGTEGLWKVWGKTERWFPIQPPKSLEIFFRAGEKVKISNFIAYFFLKVKWVEPETFTGVFCPDNEGLWKVWGKTEWWFPIQLSKNLEIFFRAGEKVKISNFIGSFFVKGKLVEPETFTGVPCPGTEGLWKVWGKTEWWFPIQLSKNLEIFFRAGEKVKISNFIGSFFVKGKLVEPETFTGVPCPGTEGLWKVWGKTEWWFPIQPSKNLEIFFGVGRKVKISNFIGSFFVKGKWVEPEIFTGGSCPGTEGLWRVWGKTESWFPFQSLKKLEIFFRVGRKIKIFNFIGSFLVKGKLVEPETFTGVSCPGTEGRWRVLGKTESWFPIQPLKNLEIFFPTGRKVKIFNFIGSFFPKGKLVAPETFTGVSCPGPEGLWRVWGQTESWFPIQPRKNL